MGISILQPGGGHGFFRNFIHTGQEVLQLSAARAVCRPVEVMGAVLHPGDAEGDALQGSAVRALFNEMEAGPDAVGEHELSILILVQLNDPLSLIHDIAGAG